MTGDIFDQIVEEHIQKENKIIFIPAITRLISNVSVNFYLRLDRIIAIAYANDPEFKDNYFIVITDKDGNAYDKSFYYVHKDIIHKYFDIDE